ncbi:MAG: hypothetical protein JWN30_1945 [Bacilli bacterium]|nr:hypothetical protein [Bacilli bacterium]
MVLALTSGVAAGCGLPAKTTSVNTAEDTSPVTISIYSTQGLTDADYQLLYVEPLKKKYPYITLQLITPAAGTQLNDLIAKGTVPDLYTTWNGDFGTYAAADMLTDITPYLKKDNIDLNRFDPIIIDSIKTASSNGEVYALPYNSQIKALYYNKDIFDKFGVAYPQDGMTWDQTIQLAKKVTGKVDGVQYRGLDYDNIQRLGTAFSTDIVDAKTQRADVNNDVWKKLYETGKSIVALPGNEPAKIDSGGVDAFFKTKTLAMLATINELDQAKDAVQNGLNFDMAQFPSFPEKMNIYSSVDANVIGLSKFSQHKEQAMRVIETLTSDEVQTISTRQTGRVSPLVNQAIREQWGADMPYLKGIHLQSVFKSKFGPAPLFSSYNVAATKFVKSEYVNYASGKKDVNTALLDAETEINQMIDADKAKQ